MIDFFSSFNVLLLFTYTYKFGSIANHFFLFFVVESSAEDLAVSKKLFEDIFKKKRFLFFKRGQLSLRVVSSQRPCFVEQFL